MFNIQKNNLFDVSHGNALNDIRSAEVKKFLMSQNQEGRQGFIADLSFMSNKESNEMEKDKQERKCSRKRQFESMQDTSQNDIHMIFTKTNSSTLDLDSDSNASDVEDFESDTCVPTVIKSETAAALDRT